MLEKTLKYSLQFFLKVFLFKTRGKQLAREYQIKMAAESVCSAVYIRRFQSFCILLHPVVSPKFIEPAGLVNIISTSYSNAHKLWDTLKLQALSEAMKV
jgi:hypothetical protein